MAERLTAHLVVALHGVDERLVCNDLRVSAEERLEALLHRLQMLLADLRKKKGVLFYIYIYI